MSAEEFRAQVEHDFAWRVEEMRLLGNLYKDAADPPAQRTLRRVQVVMLYAHFEGFCKLAFQTYLDAINQRKHRRGDVNDVLAAASLAKVFDALTSGTKIEMFDRLLPHDEGLHRFGRQVAFTKHLNDFWAEVLKVPVDTVVDTKSNLEPNVLKKLLYRMGCDPSMFAAHDGVLLRMLRLRHQVAHGEAARGIEGEHYPEMETTAQEAMKQIMVELHDVLKHERYLRAAVLTS